MRLTLDASTSALPKARRVRIDTFRDAIIPWSHSEGKSMQCQVMTMFIIFSRQWLAFRRQVVKLEIAPSATELKN